MDFDTAVEREGYIQKGRALGLTDEEMMAHEQSIIEQAYASPESNSDVWRRGWRRLITDAMAGNREVV